MSKAPSEIVRFRCKKCGKISSLSRERRRQVAGQRLACSHCGKGMVIPPEKAKPVVFASATQETTSPSDLGNEDVGTVPCPNCKTILECRTHSVGKLCQCGKCKTKFRIREVTATPQSKSPTTTAMIRRPANAAPPPPPPKPQPVEATIPREEPVFHQDEFLTVWPDGRAEFRFRSAAEAKLVIKTLRLLKRQVRLHMGEVSAALREVRYRHTDYTRRRRPMVRGRGTLVGIIRLIDAISRDFERSTFASNEQPLHYQKERLDSLLRSIEQHLVRVEAVLLRLQG